MRILSIISSTMLYLDLVCSWETFRDLIPNGYNLLHPCKKNTKWDGVGHKAFTGGGARNHFGRDFSDQGKKWTTALCNMDSDGDGNKNGEELGEMNKYLAPFPCCWMWINCCDTYLLTRKSDLTYEPETG